MDQKLCKSPLVSVVMATNRADRYFFEALESLTNQTYQNLEILIVANGMMDREYETLQVQCLDSRITLIRASLSGVSFSRNLGIQYSNSDLIAIMDADDLSYPERIERQLNLFISYPELSVCGTNYYLIDSESNVIGVHALPEKNDSIRSQLKWRNPLCNPSVMFKKSFITSIGGYTAQFAEDYDLWLKLLDVKEVVFYNLQIPLLGYRVPVVSAARRSKRAYAQVAGSLLIKFIITKNPSWLFSSFLFGLRGFFRSRQS